MMQIVCPGWPASWVNAWLAALGATALDDRISLSWTDDVEPVAILSADASDPSALLIEAWPSGDDLLRLPNARNQKGASELKRNVPVEVFVERARHARRHSLSWALSSTLTDLAVGDDGMVQHAPFDPTVPKGLTLHDRLVAVHKHVDLPSERIRASLTGLADRVQSNGLGFDYTRLGSLHDKTNPWVDPVVETLAFFGLGALPMRGPGTDGLIGRFPDNRGRQRGFRLPSERGNPLTFHWPAWSPALDSDGVDALLDAWIPERQDTWSRFGIHAAWRSVPFRPTTRNDMTRGFGAERL